MLTPKKKITKKELKHDPLLDALEKGRELYEANSKQILTGLTTFVIIMLLGWGWMNSMETAKNEAMLANTKTTLAAMQGMNANIISELELVVAEYGDNENIALTTLQLGSVRLDSGDYAGAKELFAQLAKSSDKYLKAAGKLKLAYIDEKEANYASAAKLYQDVAALDIGKASEIAKLQAGHAFVAAGDLVQAKILVTELLNNDLDGTFEEQVKFLEGKVLEK